MKANNQKNLELMQAIYLLDLPGVAVAISKDADVNASFGSLILKDKYGKDVDLFNGDHKEITPLQLAAVEEPFEELSYVFTKNNKQSAFNKEEFQKRIKEDKESDRIKIIEALIEAGADVDYASDTECSTTLQQATAFAIDEEVVKLLINSGANADQDLANDGNIFHCAAINPNPEILKFLLKKRFFFKRREDPMDDADEDGCTPLSIAAKLNPNPEIIEIFIKGGSDYNIECYSDKTAFQYADENANQDVKKMFLTLGAAK